MTTTLYIFTAVYSLHVGPLLQGADDDNLLVSDRLNRADRHCFLLLSWYRRYILCEVPHHILFWRCRRNLYGHRRNVVRNVDLYPIEQKIEGFLMTLKTCLQLPTKTSKSFQVTVLQDIPRYVLRINTIALLSIYL